MPPKIEELIEAWEQRIVDFFDGGPRRRFLYSLGAGIRRHAGAKTASAMAFNLFLAGIPALAFTGWLAAHLLGRNPDALELISLAMNLTPFELKDLVEKNFQRFGGGAVGLIVVLVAFWCLSSVFHVVMEVFEVALRTAKRSWVKIRIIAIGCALAASLMFVLTIWIGTFVGATTVLRRFRAGEALTSPVERALTFSSAAVILTVALGLFFRFAVHRPGLRRRVWWGALVTVAIGFLSSWLFFGIYVKWFARYAVYYGSLAAVAFLLAWFWIWCAALLVGAELNAQLEGGERIAPPSTVRMRMRMRHEASRAGPSAS